jgi:hypothetical protein
MLHFLRVLLLAVLFCPWLYAPRTAAAADVAVFPAEAQNLAHADGIALGELLAQSYAAASRSAVLAPSRSAGTLVQSQSYEHAARTLGVAEYVRVSALAVGRRIVVRATRHRADGTQIYQESLIADSPEDLVPVCDRLGKALYARHGDELVRTYHNVTLSESRPQNRIWREKLVGFKTGVHVPFARGARFSPAVALEFDLRLELSSYFVEFGAGVLIPTRLDDDDGAYDVDGTVTSNNRGSAGGVFAELGASRFLTDGEVGLYAGGGVVPKLLASNNDAAGLSLYAQLGLTLPRASATRFSVDLRFAQPVLAQHLNDGRRVFPGQASLLAGVGW